MDKNNKILSYCQKLCISGNDSFTLNKIDPADTFDIENKRKARTKLDLIHRCLLELQEVLYAQGKYGVLIILQAIDTGGKDGTIRKVFGPLNPQGVRVTNFKAPNHVEMAHDYLWRIHREVPARGMIGIFNRSHYEDVLITRVHNSVPKKEINKRYEQINSFEKYLCENQIVLIKFLLHISRDEQKRRLQSRLNRPDKHWKFDHADLKERVLWDTYIDAFEKALNRCSTSYAPWYVIPANHKWSRDVIVGQIIVETLQRLDLKFPEPQPGLDKLVIPE